MSNWELGVVFPPELGSLDMKKRILAAMTLKLCGQNSPEPYDLARDTPFLYDK